MVHGIKHEKDPKTCNYDNCSLSFPTWSALKIHEKKTGHVYIEQCPYCPAKFKREYYASHVQRHKESSLCQQCGKSFLKRELLERHVKDCLSLEKPYKCSVCNDGFHIQSKLDEHIRKHTNEKPFVCETCGCAFRLKLRLRYHMSSHTNDRPFVCKECGKGFKLKPTLRQHQRVHTGEKKFVCLACGASYAHSNRLKSHMVKCPYIVKGETAFK